MFDLLSVIFMRKGLSEELKIELLESLSYWKFELSMIQVTRIILLYVQSG